jgi:XRE family transcriptional regulator, master regulator for biofilm formation
MVGIKLKRLRKDKGYSLSKLSEITGISKSYLSLLERGIQKNPSIDITEKIAKALGVNINYLIKPTEDKKSQNSMIKLEINLLEDSINQEKLDQIKQLISLIGNEKKG